MSAGDALMSGALESIKNGSTVIGLPDFFGSALLALPIKLDWDAFLIPSSHESRLEMLASAMASAEDIMNRVRFELCDPWTPQTLPGRAGLLQDCPFCAGLFYARKDHESYIIGGQILTHQVIAGIGLDLSVPVKVSPIGKGDIGSITAHALRMYSEALEAGTETSRFVQLMSLIEFLANPNDYVKMEHVSKLIARQIARDKGDYHAILEDFYYLSSEGKRANGRLNRGLRHNIIHCGKRLEDLANKIERIAIFKRLARYAGASIQVLRDHTDEDWSAIEMLRKEAGVRLGLTGEDAS